MVFGTRSISMACLIVRYCITAANVSLPVPQPRSITLSGLKLGFVVWRARIIDCAYTEGVTCSIFWATGTWSVAVQPFFRTASGRGSWMNIAEAFFPAELPCHLTGIGTCAAVTVYSKMLSGCWESKLCGVILAAPSFGFLSDPARLVVLFLRSDIENM